MSGSLLCLYAPYVTVWAVVAYSVYLFVGSYFYVVGLFGSELLQSYFGCFGAGIYVFVGFLIQGIRDLITGCSDCFLVGYYDLVLCGFQGWLFHFWRRDIEISCRACGIVAFSCDTNLDDPWFYVVYIFYGIVGRSYRVEVIIQDRHVLALNLVPQRFGEAVALEMEAFHKAV